MFFANSTRVPTRNLPNPHGLNQNVGSRFYGTDLQKLTAVRDVLSESCVEGFPGRLFGACQLDGWVRLLRGRLRITRYLKDLLPALLLVGAGAIPAHAQYYGFTSSTGTGSVGDRSISIGTDARLGKRDGSYAAFKNKLEYEFTPWQDIRLAFGVIAKSHFIEGVTDFHDRDQTRFDGGSAELKWRFLKRGASSPIGAALIIEPEISRYSTNSGTRENGYELEMRLAFDSELVPKELYAAVNFLVEPELKHKPGTSEWEREIDYGVSGALSHPLTSVVDVGAGFEYRRHYSPSFDFFEGDAFFIGPSLAVKIAPKASFEFAWLAQVAGGATGDPRSLNLDHFSRHRLKAKLSYKF